MQAFGYLTLGVLLFVLIGQEIGSSNPCSQFSDPSRQALCTTDNHPLVEPADDD
ncbi:MAG: hypothetical protein HOP23_13995 [Methylococcaceae bacterium]|nr:hypothetical protein [Methylococcaceae bacterium]